MRTSSSRFARWVLPFLVLPAFVAPAYGASPADQVGQVASRLGELEGKANELDQNFRQRRGLLGPEEAKVRYQDAVYAFLVGNYQRSADAFFGLVESGALEDASLETDSEWYLAESLFQLHATSLASAAYQRIIDAGAKHPFFTDAVRRQLEITGDSRNSTAFNALYARYISSGQVAPNDLIRYTVARSFWHQGESARARSMLSEIQPGSQYSRARYLAGAILAEEGDYPNAIAEFQKVLSVPILGAADREIADLAHLALARIYYENSDYIKAVEFYQMVPPSSPYFADRLYELVWSFVKQEKWESAREQIGVFLLAFPDHRYAVQLRLVDAHLGMKLKQHEAARLAYQEVVDEYGPVQKYLAEAGESREAAQEYFTRLAESRIMDLGEGVLPQYAVEMLVANDGLGRAIELQREVERQHTELEVSQSLIEEVELAVMGGSDSIGSFSAGRKQIRDVRDESLRIRGQILAAEVEFLKQRGEGSAELSRIESSWDALADDLGSSAADSTENSDMMVVADAQVREVQAQAFRLHQQVEEMTAQTLAMRRFLKENEPKLSMADVRTIRATLDMLQDDLGVMSRDLDRLESSPTRRRVLATLGGAETTDVRARLTRECDELHSRVGGQRGRGDTAFWKQVDDQWARAIAVDSKVTTTAASLDREERKEVERLKRQLAEQTADVARHRSDLSEASAKVDEISIQATQLGFGALEDEFANTVLQADMGIVDVFWIQEVEANDEITRVKTERADRQAELEARFAIVQQKLQE